MTINYLVVSLKFVLKYSIHMDKECGLNESVKKGELLLILRIETTHKGQVLTDSGTLSLTTNMRSAYPHLTHYLLNTGS